MKTPNNEHFVNIWARLRWGRLGKAYWRANLLTSRYFSPAVATPNMLPALLSITYTPENLEIQRVCACSSNKRSGGASEMTSHDAGTAAIPLLGGILQAITPTIAHFSKKSKKKSPMLSDSWFNYIVIYVLFADLLITADVVLASSPTVAEFMQCCTEKLGWF